ncbi:hypothetical protein MPTA5024_19365 [Microbispora sp. ATCC PTA-5024]|nr:hypothetical protein MPTA5024_19365 [Microbispora sp. ATCC PTA-5024]
MCPTGVTGDGEGVTAGAAELAGTPTGSPDGVVGTEDAVVVEGVSPQATAMDRSATSQSFLMFCRRATGPRGSAETR